MKYFAIIKSKNEIERIKFKPVPVAPAGLPTLK